MLNQNDKLDALIKKLEVLSQRQNNFQIEINSIKIEIDEIRKASEIEIDSLEPITSLNPDISFKVEDYQGEHQSMYEEKPDSYKPAVHVKEENPKNLNPPIKPRNGIDLEKFIGENLISKLGIIITIIGVAIGAKYSIEHQLISPLTRIILGYITGIILVFLGLKLKEKYENYSAVLVSGSIFIMYFITYAAYSFYGLMPQLATFGLMLLFTIFAVIAAINYNRQIIAHIGLVGAYAIPFLLSDGSGRVRVFFTYVAIVNIGIILIAFKKNWKELNIAAFVATWLIFISWNISEEWNSGYIGLPMVFLSIYFVTFYLMFLAYKLVNNEQFKQKDIWFILLNSFLYFEEGYQILDDHPLISKYLGLWALFNALVHFGVALYIYKKKLVDKQLFFLVIGLVLVFITVAIPIQLDGNRVTVLWALEAAILFWIGRTKNVSFYEKLAFPLIVLATSSIIMDWGEMYGRYTITSPQSFITPIFNPYFLTSIIFIGAFIFIYRIDNKFKRLYPLFNIGLLENLLAKSIPVILLSVIYFAFYTEINVYWNQLYQSSYLEIKARESENIDYYWNWDYVRSGTIWLINYSMLFFTLLTIYTKRYSKNSTYNTVTFLLNILILAVFLTKGLYTLSELRETYVNNILGEYYSRSSFNIGIRYISFALVSLNLWSVFSSLKDDLNIELPLKPPAIFECLLSITIVWVLSSELINWLDILYSAEAYKLGLSILWGAYSLLIISIGIGKKRSHLRIGAIALFAITLLKLFFYDITHLSTISKTVVFMLLGCLLLVISFLYNKFKHLIVDEEK